MRYVLFLLLMMSSGCVLNQPQSFVYITETNTSNVSNTSSVSTKTIKETPAHKPAPVVINRTVQTTNIKCAVFELPTVGVMPSRPVFSSPEAQAKGEPDEVLVAHIKALEDYIAHEHDNVINAHREWKKSCK